MLKKKEVRSQGLQWTRGTRGTRGTQEYPVISLRSASCICAAEEILVEWSTPRSRECALVPLCDHSEESRLRSRSLRTGRDGHRPPHENAERARADAVNILAPPWPDNGTRRHCGFLMGVWTP